MRRKRDRCFSGLAGLLAVLAMLAAGLPVQAGLVQAPPSPTERWLPFDGTSGPEEPALTLLAADAAKIELHADLPGAYAADLEADGQRFTRLYGPGYGHGTEFGLPDLPVLRREVEIPYGAAVSLEMVQAEYSDYTLVELGLQAIYPLQPPLPKVPGAEDRPLSIDHEFYANGRIFPASPLALGEAYVVRGHRVLPVEVWPVAYDPSAATVRLYRRVTFRLRLEGGDVVLTAAMAERYASPAFEQRLSRTVLNYNQGRPGSQLGIGAPVGYLIITADAYYDAMLPFANLRAGRGFDVTMLTCTAIGGCLSANNVKAYIQNAYDTWPIPPSYVLLVGDTDTVAGWASQAAGEITDLYYATMDGAGDWHPDIGRGRFPVRSPAQTTLMVDKYLLYANLTGQEPWLKNAAFPATCDLYQVAEGTHNYVIDTHTGPNGYTGNFPNPGQYGGDKLYCITYGATGSDIQTALNDGRWVVIYSGHGSHTGWEMGYGQSQVRSLTNYGMFPFVASHACITGDFSLPEVYGETWVLQENKAALAFWGSSDSSYWDEDDVLERVMFDSLFAPGTPHADVTEMTYDGLAAVETSYPGSARYYWETYNVLGDPALKVFLEPDLPTFLLSVEPTAHELCSSGSVTSSVVIASLLGYSETVYLETGPLPVSITATFDPASAPAPFTATLTLQVAPGTPADDYAIVVTATDSVSWTHDTIVNLRVATAPPDAPALVSPPDGAVDQDLQPTFEWDPPPLASGYRLQVDYSPLFGAPLIDVADLIDPEYTPAEPLAGGRCHWWRVQGDNTCGTGAWASPFHFATVALRSDFFDDIEAGPGLWTEAVAQGVAHWHIVDSDSHSPTHAWFVEDDDITTDSRLWNTAAVPLVSGSLLTFWHRFGFESSWDGGVIEISTNGGASWSDLGNDIVSGGYNGTLYSSGNPLGGRPAWTGSSGGWEEVVVDLSDYAGQSAHIRWREGCDGSVGAEGWHVDDVLITSPLPPNPAPLLDSIVPDHGSTYVDTPVQILGSAFLDTPSARLGQTWLLSITLVSSTTLDAVVPAGMPAGTYDLILYNGDCQQAILPDAFTVIAQCITPTVELDSDSPVELGTAMHFTATMISGTAPFTYSWDFGGPGYGSGLDSATPVYTYTSAGAYSVSVLVENPCGSDASTTTVEVFCVPPAASIESDSPVQLGQAMHFTSSVTGTGPFTYSWDLGDGLGSSDQPNPVYTYTAAGDYTVTLTVEGACGTDVATTTVTVISGCLEPQVDVASDSPVLLGQPTHFTSTVSGTEPFTYSWDFGDGLGSSDQPHPVYTYTAAGEFTVTLTVENACGQDTAVTLVTVVSERLAPEVYIASDSPVDLGQPMRFTSTVSGIRPFTYTWDFGDGLGSSSLANPTYTYTTTGQFTVTLTVDTPCGSDMATILVTVRPITYRYFLPLVFKAHTP